MTKTVVFSDMHGRDFVVKDLMRKIGLMDDEGNRAEGFYTIQIGDLVSLGYNEQEAEFLSWVRPFLDFQCVGNHDVMAFTPYPNYMEFVGWDQRDTVAEQMIRSEFNQARREGNNSLWMPATHVGDWFISHAGMSPAVQRELGKGKTAEQYAKDINELWLEHITDRIPDPIFIGTGEHNGGIFWLRMQYLRAGYRYPDHVKSVVGHTPVDHNPKFTPPAYQNKDKSLIGIDTMGSCCALITEDEGETWDIVTSDYESRFWEERGKIGENPRAIKEIRPLI